MTQNASIDNISPFKPCNSPFMLSFYKDTKYTELIHAVASSWQWDKCITVQSAHVFIYFFATCVASRFTDQWAPLVQARTLSSTGARLKLTSASSDVIF